MKAHALRRLAPSLLGLALVFGAGAFWLLPSLAQPRPEAQPRAQTPRGALEADELNHIKVFRTVSPSVVHITTTAVQRDLLRMVRRVG